MPLVIARQRCVIDIFFNRIIIDSGISLGLFLCHVSHLKFSEVIWLVLEQEGTLHNL